MIPGQTRRSAALTASASLPHFVYKCYDADDLLIYVGCTSDVDRRIYQHQHVKPTGTLASRVLSACMTRVEVSGEYPDRAAGQEAEQQAIRDLQPLLNANSKTMSGWQTNLHIEDYLLRHGLTPDDFDLSRCLYCNHLRGYRATGYICQDCHEPEFRAYVDELDRSPLGRVS